MTPTWIRSLARVSFYSSSESTSTTFSTGGKGEFHVLLALAHNKGKMTELFQNAVVSEELITSLKNLLRNGNNLDENKSILTVNSACTTIHLHLHGLLHPGVGEGVVHVSSNVFVANDAGIPQIAFLSTIDLSKPACWTSAMRSTRLARITRRKMESRRSTAFLSVCLKAPVPTSTEPGSQRRRTCNGHRCSARRGGSGGLYWVVSMDISVLRK
ncbi:hypothetical protein CGCSCA1_v012759 [Colletotrichum siamense]|nr:hypothetical protein CGCSCA1_v012759 [Colletotrichum siamense]